MAREDSSGSRTPYEPLADDRARGLALMRRMSHVPRETEERLAALVALLTRWQKAQNLVSAGTLSEIWTRHIADSAQVLVALPGARRWLDLGSGAGFPGLVTAILLADDPAADVRLVESNARKCAFLRAAIRETGAPATVHHGRIEDVVAGWRQPVDAVSARALAPLTDLIAMSAPLFAAGAVAVFHKGRDVEVELTDAARSWSLKVERVPSRTEPGAAVVVVRDCAAKSA